MAKQRINSRAKGYRGESQGVDWLKSLGFHDAYRTQQHNGKSPFSDSDVRCPDTLPNVHLEVKFWATFDSKKLRSACLQAENDKKPGQAAVVIWRCTDDKNAKEFRITYLYKGRMMSIPPTLMTCRNKLIEFNNAGSTDVPLE